MNAHAIIAIAMNVRRNCWRVRIRFWMDAKPQAANEDKWRVRISRETLLRFFLVLFLFGLFFCFLVVERDDVALL